MVLDATLRPRANALATWNLVAIGIFLVAGLAAVILTVLEGADARDAQLTTDIGGSVMLLATYKLYVTELPYVFIAALVHFLAYRGTDCYYKRALCRGEQRLRWWEYSITNGLMTLSLAQLAGITNVLLLVALLLANVSMNYAGYVTEQLNAGKHLWTKATLPIVMGFAPYVAIWVATLVSHFSPSVAHAAYDTVAVLGSFALSLAFVAPLVYRANIDVRRTSEVRANFNVERAYIVLSLVAKLFLLFTVSIGDLVD
jgi:hypothetical protein